MQRVKVKSGQKTKCSGKAQIAEDTTQVQEQSMWILLTSAREIFL